MIKKLIGRILPKPQGDWSPAKNYNKLDFVIYNGSGYVAIKDSSNKRPGHGDYWMELHMQGVWDSHHIYSPIDLVKYDENFYLCKYKDVIVPPEQDKDNNWQPVKFKGTWVKNDDYDKYDIVAYVGNFYMCRTDNQPINTTLTDKDYWKQVTYKGVYDINTIYELNEVVESIDNNKIGFIKVTPAEIITPDEDNQHWEMLNMKNDWLFETIYDKNDVVTCDDSYFVAIKSTKGNYPTSREYWTLVAERGLQGLTGPAGNSAPNFVGTYSDTQEYHALDIVLYDGSSWVCMKDNVSGIAPSLDKTWKLACKGVDYNIDNSGEVTFKTNGKTNGVKTFVDNVYIKSVDQYGVNVQIPLSKKLEELEDKLNRCLSILEKYDLLDDIK